MTAQATGTDHLVDRVRALCMAFPQTQERPSHGEACWFVGGKRMFVMFADHHHDDRVAFWAAADDAGSVCGSTTTPTGTVSSCSSRRPGAASPDRA